MTVAARRLYPGLLLLALALTPELGAQDVPLEHCDRLPAVRVEVAAHQPMLFLVDTAASSLLNLQSFVMGTSREIGISSFLGTMNTRAREVRPPEMKIGSYHLAGVKMMAIDLSALSASCGRRIDGILGADLLEKMGATIDFKRQVVHFMTADERGSEQLFAEVSRDVQHCLAALSTGNEEEQECLEPEITVVAGRSVIYSRESALGWLREHYANFPPGAAADSEVHIQAHLERFHAVGEAVWFEYDVTVSLGSNSWQQRGMAMCRKNAGRWRIANLSPASAPVEIPAGR